MKNITGKQFIDVINQQFLSRGKKSLLCRRSQMSDSRRSGRVDLGHLEHGSSLQTVGVILQIKDSIDVDVFLKRKKLIH